MGPSMKVLCGVVYLASTAALMSMLPPSFKNIMILTTTVMITENMQRTNYPYQDQNGCDRRSKMQIKLFRTVIYMHVFNTHLHETTATQAMGAGNVLAGIQVNNCEVCGI